MSSPSDGRARRKRKSYSDVVDTDSDYDVGLSQAEEDEVDGEFEDDRSLDSDFEDAEDTKSNKRVGKKDKKAKKEKKESKKAKKESKKRKKEKKENEEDENEVEDEEDKEAVIKKKARRKAIAAKMVPEYTEENIKAAFASIDKDKKGFITCEDLITSIADIGRVIKLDLRYEELQEMLARADRAGNNDGLVNVDDVVAVARLAGLC